MAFDTFESAQETSQPIEIIKIQIGAVAHRWTSSEDEITVNSEVYTPIPIQRGRIVQSPEDREGSVEFTVDGDNTFARQYIAALPGNRALLTVQRIQRADFPGPEAVTLYQGYVDSVKFSKNGYGAIISTRAISAAMSRTIPRYTYQGVCNHILYGAGCNVDEGDAEFLLSSAEVLTVDGADITVQGADGKADGWYTGGYVEALNGEDSRLILSHVGTTLTLMQPFAFSTVGTIVSVLAGCDHTIATCGSKFFTTEDVDSNVINYGGFHFVPTRDIFQNGIDK
tara:strand:+ start:111 stop:959 length:849 start_codon:yes stop_codon:yes gene_type:complete